MSLVVIFPVGKEAEADDYLDYCNSVAMEGLTPWYLSTMVDRYGQRVVGYYGVGGHGSITETPPGEEAYRVDGVLQEGFDPPLSDL